LIEEIWGYAFEGNERTLDVHINRLREHFTEGKYSFKITTIRGLGYRLEVVGREGFTESCMELRGSFLF
jgi:two-component system OmpR family response regulator